MKFGPAKLRNQNNLNVVTVPADVVKAMKLKLGDLLRVEIEKEE